MFDNLNSDMSQESTHAFFAERDPALEMAISGMESVETWTRDRVDRVQEMLQKFADRVEEVDWEHIDQQLRNRLIVLMGYISSGKAIKLLMWMEQTSPNFVAKTLADAQMLAVLDKVNEHAAKLFVERFEVLERMHMLSRIFSEDRLAIVKRVLRILAGEDPEEIEDDEYDEEDQYASA